MTIGTRAQVWHGTADKTSGGLRKKDLFMKNGRIKSRRQSKLAKRNQNLRKAGWTFKKGTFGAIRIDDDEGVVRKRKVSSSRRSKRSSVGKRTRSATKRTRSATKRTRSATKRTRSAKRRGSSSRRK